MTHSVARPKAIVYIDGLNLYHSHLRRKPELKWLNLLQLVELQLPNFEIDKVHYFTAIVSSKISDPLAPTRQKAYIRALETLGEKLEIHHGRIRVEEITVRTKGPEGQKAKAYKSTEKESDVGLASQMVHDAHTKDADYLVLLSNDTDFAPALRLIKQNTEKRIGLLSPSTKVAGDLMETNPDIVWILNRFLLGEAQLPETISDLYGESRRPDSWT